MDITRIQFRAKRINDDLTVCGDFTTKFGGKPQILAEGQDGIPVWEDIDVSTLRMSTMTLDIYGETIFQGENVTAKTKRAAVNKIRRVSFKNGCFYWGDMPWPEFLEKYHDFISHPEF